MDDRLAEAVKATAGDNVSGWLATLVRAKLLRRAVTAEIACDQQQPDYLAWRAERPISVDVTSFSPRGAVATVIGCLVAVGIFSALAACGPSAPPSGSSISQPLGTVPSTALSVPVSTTAPSSTSARPSVFSGMKILGQRSVDSKSEDDPAAYRYRLRYSLDSIDTREMVDPGDTPGLVRTRIITSATVLVTNITPNHEAPLGDLRGIMLGGVYKLNREICQQRQILVSGRGNYCFASLWVSPDNPGELAAGETRQLGDSSPTMQEIGPLAKKTKDSFVRDLLTPDFYFVASLSNGYNFVPENRCTLLFDLTNGDAIIDTQPHVNVCNSEG